MSMMDKTINTTYQIDEMARRKEKRAPHGAGFVYGFLISVAFWIIVIVAIMEVM